MQESVRRFLSSDLVSLIDDGDRLLASIAGGFHDYSFVVFPFAKAYEGYLKKMLFQIGAITEWQFHNDRWRVGRALNPQLEKDLRHDESAYDHLVQSCGGTALADELWRVWKKGRNALFHYYPDRFEPLGLVEAKEIVGEIKKAMEKGLVECKISD